MAVLGNPKNTIAELQKYNFNFQKKFGQNFLINEAVLEEIIEEAGRIEAVKAVYAVHIKVVERHRSLISVDYRKGGAGHASAAAKPRGHAPRKRRLAHAKPAGIGDDVPRAQLFRKAPRKLLRVTL